MNRERLLAAAKAKALALVKDYKAPTPVEFHLAGPSGKTALLMAADGFVRLGKATAHDRVVAEALATVLSGGPEADHTLVTTEDKVTKLEREAILGLMRQPKTLARMEHTLATGKPLRN
jgi:3-hydroxyacyl-CoA dehydrogenase